MLRLCFKELFEWKMMQTDPNPANFIYDMQKQRLNLIDFGSARHFDEKFINSYMGVVYGAFKEDHQMIIQASKELGFLTGEENKECLGAHYKAALAVAIPFRY